MIIAEIANQAAPQVFDARALVIALMASAESSKEWNFHPSDTQHHRHTVATSSQIFRH
jgi:hypothetical protein